MPPSVATAIAEGHLDPVTMEAFDCFLSPGYQKDHVATQPSRRPKKSEITLVSKADTGFIVFSSRKTSEKVISGKYFIYILILYFSLTARNFAFVWKILTCNCTCINHNILLWMYYYPLSCCF